MCCVLLIVAIIWQVQYNYRWRDDGAQLERLRASLQLRVEERALFSHVIETKEQLLDEHARLVRSLDELFHPKRPTGLCCEIWPDYILQISGLVDRMARDERDPSFELMALTPGSRLTAGDATSWARPFRRLGGYPIRTFQMTLDGRFQTLVHFLRRLQNLEPNMLVVVSRVQLSPCTADWNGPWTAWLEITTYLGWPHPES